MAERRWTIWNVSKRFTVEKATASPITLGDKVEVLPVSEHEALRSKIKAEVELMREDAAECRDIATHSKTLAEGNSYVLRGKAIDIYADRLEALLNPTEGEK